MTTFLRLSSNSATLLSQRKPTNWASELRTRLHCMLMRMVWVCLHPLHKQQHTATWHVFTSSCRQWQYAPPTMCYEL
jgi:hypothetical protein